MDDVTPAADAAFCSATPAFFADVDVATPFPAGEPAETSQAAVVQLVDAALNALAQTLVSQGYDLNAAMAFSLRLSDDAEVQNLNMAYRNKNKPTNVLSFPFGEELDGVYYLGDIIVSVPTTLREAAEKNVSPAHHLSHLVVHGVLHLLGFDHETDPEADEMEGLEIIILQHLHINNPYQPVEDNSYDR